VDAPAPELAPVDQLLVLSGSCSPVTGAQVSRAAEGGFAMVWLDPVALGRGDDDVAAKAANEAAAAWRAGRSVVLYSAGDGARQLGREVSDRPAFRETLAEMSGRVLCAVLDQCSNVKRVVVAGGDTSSHAGSLLGIQALSFVCPLAPGAPMCRAFSGNPRRDGLEVVFKGGQCGGRDFFLKVRGD
jgi:uncharacterized protein YgbK (DUF1537 family)